MSCVSAIGGFLFGYDTSVIAGANLYLYLDFPGISNLQKEFIVSLTMIGAAVGSLCGGVIADRYGRRLTIIMADIVFIIGAVVMAIAPLIAVLMIG